MLLPGLHSPHVLYWQSASKQNKTSVQWRKQPPGFWWCGIKTSYQIQQQERDTDGTSQSSCARSHCHSWVPPAAPATPSVTPALPGLRKDPGAGSLASGHWFESLVQEKQNKNEEMPWLCSQGLWKLDTNDRWFKLSTEQWFSIWNFLAN